MEEKSKYDILFDSFRKLKVLIIGDVMVDSYLWGKVDRISAEAPVPVVVLQKRENRLGGAANVALNIKSMGAIPLLCSVIGNDRQAELFLQLMQEQGLDTGAIIQNPDRITTTKFRIMGNNAQLLRVDEEIQEDLSIAGENILMRKVTELIRQKEVNVIILQDYNKGVLTRELIRRIIDIAAQNGIPLTVDPKKRNFDAYRGSTLFKPNLKELKEGMKPDLDTSDRHQLEIAINIFRETNQIDIVLATLSEDGIMVSGLSDEQPETHHIPAHRRSITDVSGAGDTVIAVASLCLASHASLFDLASISNLAGGLVCEEAGVVPVNMDSLLSEVKLNMDHATA